jgi:hypothetical protein
MQVDKVPSDHEEDDDDNGMNYLHDILVQRDDYKCPSNRIYE